VWPAAGLKPTAYAANELGDGVTEAVPVTVPDGEPVHVAVGLVVLVASEVGLVVRVALDVAVVVPVAVDDDVKV